jgi:hypothetical protein
MDPRPRVLWSSGLLWMTPIIFASWALGASDERGRLVLGAMAACALLVRLAMRVVSDWSVTEGGLAVRTGPLHLHVDASRTRTYRLSETYSGGRWLLVVPASRWWYGAWVALDDKDETLQVALLEAGGRVHGAWLTPEGVMTRKREAVSRADSFFDEDRRP